MLKKKTPIRVAGLEFTGDNLTNILEFMLPDKPVYISNANGDAILGIRAMDGFHVVQKGDFIVQYY